MASTIKVTNIDTPDGTGNITVDRPLSGSGASLTALNATQLTSGTLPIARIANDAITLAKMASESVDEDNLYISNAGTNGQFLSKQSGNSGGLTWADAGGGSWEYVSTSTSGTARDFNNVFSWSTYPAYLFVMDMAMDNAGGGLGARFYNSSNTLVTSGYQWNYAVLNSNASTWSISNNNSDSWMKFSNYPCNAIPLWCSLLVRQANGRQSIQADCTWVHTQGSSYHGRSVAGGLLFNSDTCSGIHIKQWSGVFQGGNIHMYRLKKT